MFSLHFGVLLFSCQFESVIKGQGEAMEHSQGFLNLVKDVKTRIREEDYRETKKKMDTGEKIQPTVLLISPKMKIRAIRARMTM